MNHDMVSYWTDTIQTVWSTHERIGSRPTTTDLQSGSILNMYLAHPLAVQSWLILRVFFTLTNVFMRLRYELAIFT